VNYEKQIGELRTRLGTLNALLDEKRTPRLKWQVKFAGHCLDDAESVIRDAAKASNPAGFYAFAGHSIQHATQICETIEKLGNGDPSKLIEV
jgi:hypothetical protein